jgi:UDP-N-acetylmuramyl pentapeptide phosphotransferase/UDP-N-acetylglucosamine-1-phosphate transferase
MTSLSWITLLAFALSVAFCLGFRGLAREWHLIDIPDARKRHDGNVPLCGGIAIFLSFSAATFLAFGVSGHANAMALLPGLVLILVAGVLDDRFNLPVAPRLAIQLLAAFLIIAITGVTQTYLGLASDGIETAATSTPEMLIQVLTGPLFLIIALAFIVGLVNARASGARPCCCLPRLSGLQHAASLARTSKPFPWRWRQHISRCSPCRIYPHPCKRNRRRRLSRPDLDRDRASH